MSKIILFLILGGLGYVAFRRWIAPASKPQRGSDSIPEANWTPVDASVSPSDGNDSCAVDASAASGTDCGGGDGGGGGGD